MFNLENLLASKLLAKKHMKSVSEPDVVIDEDNSKIYFVFKYDTGKTRKDGSRLIKFYKNDITKYVHNHGGLENLFKALVAAEMLVAGYMIIPIQGGYICAGGEELYNLKDNECTCPAFLNNPNKPCKHLIYRDAILLQRSRMNQWKQTNLKNG